MCFTGMLSNQWTVADFYPIEYIPTGVRLSVPIDRTYALDEIARPMPTWSTDGDGQARRPPVSAL